jgi:hypothetical protein
MSLNIERPTDRIVKNLRIRPETAKQIDDLAEAYNTTQGKIIEAIFETYTPALMRDAQRSKK